MRKIRFYCIKKVINIKKQEEVQKKNTNTYKYYKEKYKTN